MFGDVWRADELLLKIKRIYEILVCINWMMKLGSA
jgi:hypothetical protein